jgi:hypothetical protein
MISIRSGILDEDHPKAAIHRVERGRAEGNRSVPDAHRPRNRKFSFSVWLGRRVAGIRAHRTLDGRFKYLNAAVVSHRNIIPGPGETRPFGSNPMGNEAGVPLGLHVGRTIVPHEIMGGQVTSKVKEKSLHGIKTRG